MKKMFISRNEKYIEQEIIFQPKFPNIYFRFFQEEFSGDYKILKNGSHWIVPDRNLFIFLSRSKKGTSLLPTKYNV